MLIETQLDRNLACDAFNVLIYAPLMPVEEWEFVMSLVLVLRLMDGDHDALTPHRNLDWSFFSPCSGLIDAIIVYLILLRVSLIRSSLSLKRPA